MAERVETLRDWLAEHPPDPARFTQSAAGVARRTLTGDDFFVAVRELLDELALADPAQRECAIADRPPPTGDPRHDAYLGALAEHVAVSDGLRLPTWTQDADRFLDRFWFVSSVEGFRAVALAQSPAAFRRRGIFVPAASLQRV
jgi:hypothetical protein